MFTWSVMYSLWRSSACLLMLGFVSSLETLKASNIVLQPTETCPKSGYYYSKGPIPVQEGPCYLCLCQQGNSTAVCRETARRLCDEVESKVGLTALGHTRARRSPIGLSDIFFRDATRDFFNKQLPEQCKPYEGSFSDGCPPADWCVGCTVCDCDANGRWDCHILSFCNGEEKKKKLQGKKVPLPKNMPTRRVYHQNKSTPKNKATPKPKKVVKKSIPKPQGRQRPKQNARKQQNNKKASNNSKKPNNNRRKPANISKKPNNSARQSNIKKRNLSKGKPKPQPKRKPTTKKPHRKRFLVKKPQHMRTTIKQPTTPIPDKKVLRKAVNVGTTEPQSEVTNLLNPESNLEEAVLGRQIIKKVMTTVQKMIGKQMEKLQNSQRVQRSINNKDCPKNKKNKKQRKTLYDYNLRKKKLKNYRQHYNFRKKREALDLDISMIKLNDANLMKDNQIEDLSVRRFAKNVTEFDFGDSNTTNIHDEVEKELGNDENSTNTNVTVHLTTDKYTTVSSANKIPILNSTSDNQYYKYSIGHSSSNATITTELAPTKNNINNTSKVENYVVTVINKNITKYNAERAKQYAIIMNDPEFNEYKKWERIQIPLNNIKNNHVTKSDEAKRKFNGSNFDKFKRLKNKIRRKDIKIKLNVTNKHNLKKIINNNFKTASSNYIGTTLIPSNASYNISSLQILLQNLMKELNRNSTTPIKVKTKFTIFKYLRNIFKSIFSKKKGIYRKNHNTNEGVTLEILCENIGACFLNKHNKIALRHKIHDLNAETEKIFKTIKVIKGLLFLIEMPVRKENTTMKPRNDEMQKLDAILRETYGENITLTETQAAQINYVKENIHQFIEYVGRFATILNEIIDVLYKNNKKYSCQRNLRLSHRKKKLNSFNKIKILLVKYNIVQNTFMKKMFQLLTDAEKNTTTENPKQKVSDRDLNNTKELDRYSKNIIENLRKLKNLAQALNSSRRKRHTTRDDDAMEYLLMLMEYLLKQNHPLDTPPVNDGIDLLIEAIQNAPDIKPIQRKVLYDFPTTSTTDVELSYFKEDSISDSNKISKEDSSKNENNLAIEQVLDNEDEITQVVYYKRFDDNDNSTFVYNEYYPTTEYSANNASKKKKNSKNEEKTGFERFESAIDDTRRYEVFTSDIEDEPIIPIEFNTTVKPTPTTVTTKVEESTFVALRDYKIDDDPAPPKKTKLDWIEENFDKEIREYRDDKVSETTISSAYTTQATTVKPEDKNIDNISSITVELDEEEKKKSKVGADEVMYRKQIAFLNSLDYGTERSEFDDSGLKDDEKYSGDGFPSYFVK